MPNDEVREAIERAMGGNYIPETLSEIFVALADEPAVVKMMVEVYLATHQLGCSADAPLEDKMSAALRALAERCRT